jgi:predicted DNA-binding antitoxin AbrB/MazE fold protein
MIVTGTYENGRLKLPDTIRLKHHRVNVKVEIPDNEKFAQTILEDPTYNA